MPIVDGLTSTKMIRSYEKTHNSHSLSERARLNYRIPIIAVSASLLERERQTYIDAGFDAWILKPVSFDRLQILLTGIVDPSTREDALYKPGKWESGGWFEMAHKGSKWEAITKPDASEPSTDLGAEAAVPDGKLKPNEIERPAGNDGAAENDGTKQAEDIRQQKADDTKQQEDAEEQAMEGIEGKDKEFFMGKSMSAPAAFSNAKSAGSDEVTPTGPTGLVSDEPAMSETPDQILSPPAT